VTDDNQRPRGRPGTADDTRERLVSAAVEVFLERGYSNTRVQDITRAAGFTTGALYAHFKNREEILAVALVREGERLVRNLAHELENIDIGTDPSIHLVAEGLTDPLHTTDRLMLEALTMATRKDNVRDQMLPAVNLARDTLTEGVKAGLEAGVIPEGTDPEAMSLVFLSMLLGSTMVRALDLPRADVEDLFNILKRTNAVIDG
jgi:AcrR family transcriptional regulator